MSQTTSVISPNTKVMPATAFINDDGHLQIGGCDVVSLAKEFGTPLYIIDEQTVRMAIEACRQGLSSYSNAQILYAGKAFLCTAMCALIHKLGAGLDVVSEGELYTAMQAGFPANLLFMHGNNKSEKELELALTYDGIRIVVDNLSEIELLQSVARRLGKKARIMLRVIPGVAADTHKHIQTGQSDSKFGLPLSEIDNLMESLSHHKEQITLLGFHAHIGSQIHNLESFIKTINILADLYKSVLVNHGIELTQLDVGGGLGIAYTGEEQPTPLFDWASTVARQTAEAFTSRNLKLPELYTEPGRSIIGTAGVTIYKAGHCKEVSGTNYIAVDGGMADNPRPITYQARHTAKVANRMNEAPPAKAATLVGKYCESGDIIVRDAQLSAKSGDLIAVFGTGAYNYSMASNYNRTGRPACVLVNDGKAEVIISRETNADLVRLDRVPDRLR